jgi:hypothetical protein
MSFFRRIQFLLTLITIKMNFIKIFKSALFAVAVGVLSLTVSSCKKEGCTDDRAENYNPNARKDDGSCILPKATVDPTTSDKADVTGLTKIADGTTDAGTKIEVYGMEKAFAGYNYLYLATYDKDGKLLKEGKITLSTLMDMGTSKHASPIENPSVEKANEKGLYTAQVYFTMPSSSGSWTLSVTYLNAAKTEEKASISISVEEPKNRVYLSFTASDDSSKVFVGWAMPSKPKVGVNDMELVAFYKKDMMMFPAQTGLTFEIVPEMPSMGHGSPNNVNPSETGNGHYMGKVNFTMSGYWKINLKVKRKGAVIADNLYFDYSL